MNILAKIFKQTFWQVLGKVVTALSTFVILGIVARNYKEEGTGVFTLVLTFLSMFFLLGDFGFNAHILKQATGYRQQVTDKWQKLLGLRILWSGALIVLSLLLLPFLPFSLAFKQAAIFGCLAILGSGIFVTCNLIFQQKLRYDLSVLSSSIGTIIYLLVILFLTSNQSDISLLAFAFAIGWIFIGITSLFFVKKFVDNIWPKFDLAFTKNLIKDSWPIAATLFLNVIYFRADSFMVAFFKGTVDAGIYNIAYSVFQSALVLPTFIMNAYYPLMLRSLKGLRFVGIGLFAIAIFGTVTIQIFAPTIIDLLTGEGFLGSSQSLQILSLGFPAYFLSALLMWLMITKGFYKKTLGLYTLTALLNLLLNLIYIPQYSFIAAAWITVACEYVILILQIIALRRILLK